MKNEELKNILEELYLIDPELKKYEARLVVIIEKFLESKPDTKFDEEFARNLKAKILSEPMPEHSSTGSIFNIFNMKRNYLIYSGAAMAVLLIAVISIQTMSIKTPSAPTLKQQINLSDSATVTKLAANAFGSISSSNNAGVTQNMGSMPVATGRGGGGGVVSPMVGAAIPASSGVSATESAPAVDSKMMIYQPYQIRYVYKGEKVDLKDKTMDVYRRIKPQLNTSEAAGALNRLSFGGINLGSFTGTQITNFELSQPTSDGYVINVNLRDGMISLNENYFAMNPCPGGICPTVQPLRPSDMPTDEAVIEISNKFLKDHGINMANYVTPKLENDWRKTIESTSPSFAPYIPDVISVVYGNQINGSPVYELGGGISGLRVNVDVRKKVVTGVWSVMNQKYESSAYETETDSSRIIKLAENGGIYNGGYADANIDVVEVELGTPTKVFVNMWKNDGSGEVIVPALSFPVTKGPADKQYYYQTNIVIPLVKELLNIPDPGPIRIMDASASVSNPEPAIKAQ